MTERAIYDWIGVGYTAHRRPDRRLQARIDLAIGDAATVVNVGAGTGSYEGAAVADPDQAPTGRRLVAVERSRVMIDGRPAGAAPVVQGCAEALPLPDGSFDVALALMTLHHWTDWRAGVAELQRVAHRQVLFVFEPDFSERFWLIAEYFPEVLDQPSVQGPTVAELALALGGPGFVDTIDVPIPHDFEDALLWANWRHPEAYLDPSVLRCNSATAQLPPAVLAAGCDRLRADLGSGAWHDHHADLLERDEVDGGLRLLVTHPVP